MTPAPDPVYDPNLDVDTRRGDILMIRFDPGNATATTFTQIPLLSELMPPTPNITVNRKVLFVDTDSKRKSLVSTTEDGGKFDFMTAAPGGNATVKLLFAFRNKVVLWKQIYADGQTEQGQGVLHFRGRMGAATDVPEYAWTIEAHYIDIIEPV